MKTLDKRLSSSNVRRYMLRKIQFAAPDIHHRLFLKDIQNNNLQLTIKRS